MPLRARPLPKVVVVCVFVAAAAIGLIFTRPGPESYDAKIMLQVTESMVERGDFRVAYDEFGFNSPYSSYGIGMSVLFAVPYEVMRLTGASTVRAANAAMTTNAFLFALCAVAVLLLARELDLSWGQALVTTGLIAGGTMLLPYVPTGFSELAVAGLVGVGLFAVAAQRQRRPWAALVGGAAGGAAALFRSDSLALILVPIAVGVWLASGRQAKSLARVGAGAAPFLLIWAWYNNLRFGSPFKLGYKDTDGFSYPFIHGLHGLLWSPGRGLLFYVPLVVVAAIGARWAWRRDPVLTAVAGTLLAVRPLLFASWSQWEGGVCWGPRFLVPAMPALAIGVAEVVRRWRTLRVPAQAALVTIAALSVGVQLVGTIIGYEHHWNKVRPLAEAKGEAQEYLYAWEYFPIRDEAGWLFTRPDLYVGRAMPPGQHPLAFTLLLLTGLGAAVAAGATAKGASVRKNGAARLSSEGGIDDGRHDHDRRPRVRLLPAGGKDPG